jgi:sigma-E factor negative regulatory protein RseA
MSELLREQMSAFLDDALPGEETDLLVRRLGEDAELTRTYACYHLIGATMRLEPDASALAGRVRNALREETLTPVRRRAWQRWLKPVAGIAVAASVAVVAITSVRVMEAGRVTPTAATAQMLPGAEPASYTVAPPHSNELPAEMNGRARLATYVMRHGNYANMPNSPVMNYRSLVGVGQMPAAGDGEESMPADEAKDQEPQAK